MAALALLVTTAIWGWTFVLVKEAMAEVGPFWFLAIRFLLATFLALPFVRRGKMRWKEAAILGFFLFLGYFFQTWGLRYTTAQKSGLITGLSVVLVPLVARFFGEKVTLRTGFGVVFAAAGVVLLALGGEEALGPTGFGDFLTVICAISFALYIVLLARYAKGERAGPLLPGQLGAVAGLSALGAGIFGEATWSLSPAVWRAILITGTLASTLAYYILTWAESRASATETAVILAMEPVFAGLFGWALRGEALTSVQLLGGVLVLAGMIVASIIDGGKAGPDNPAPGGMSERQGAGLENR
ncbi:MAG: DMT family transporter [Candidatus Bipolaricaulota bacterium]|nr:DMT family transporter [Candidatus Bipolaricaulota bacterium]MDW8126399.1 DMT family transporter [Candidatus Bipolaricaulota bacterium]